MGRVIFSGKNVTGKRTGRRRGVYLARWCVIHSRRLGAMAVALLLAAFGLGVGVARHVGQATAQLDFDQQQALLAHIGDLSARIVQLEMEANGLASRMGTLKEFEARMQMDDVTVRQGPRAKTQPSTQPIPAPAPQFNPDPAADLEPDVASSPPGGMAESLAESLAESTSIGGPFLQTDDGAADADYARPGAAAHTDDAPDEWVDVTEDMHAAISRLPDNLVQSLGAVHGTLERLTHALAGLNEHAQTITLAHMAFPGRRPVSADASWVSSIFGKRKDPFNTRLAFHSGMDFAASLGTPIYASAGGKVVFAGHRPAYGKTVEIDHGNGMVTRYAHAHKLLVKKGQVVLPGQTVAQVGSSGRSTGTHLHFEIIKDGYFVDPAPYLARF